MHAHSVNLARGSGVADWDDQVWLSFDPGAAIVLGE